MNVKHIGEGTVELIAGGGRIYTDVAARFVRSEKPLRQIIDAPYSPELVRKIVDSGHKAAIEFDYFIFGVEGYSRVTEVQLVRKRLASYMIKSGRAEKKGRRSFDVVLPKDIMGIKADFSVKVNNLTLPGGQNLSDVLGSDAGELKLSVDADDILNMAEEWYQKGIEDGVPEEDLRYLKPQATEFKAIIGMNAHALMDWFAIRCCVNAQAEIRDMANKMLAICKQTAPDIFKDAGPNCKLLGYCPENIMQNRACKGRTPTKSQVMELLRQAGYKS